MKLLSLSEIDKQNAKDAAEISALQRDLDEHRETIRTNEGLNPENFETYESYQNSRRQIEEAKQQITYKTAQLKKLERVTPEEIQTVLYSLERERDELIKRNMPDLIKLADKITTIIDKMKAEDAQISRRYEVFRNLHTAQHYPQESNIFFMNNRLLKINKFCEGFYYDPINGEHYKRP